MEQTKDILHKVILGGLFLVLVFPLFGDYGTLLFPLGRDILFRVLIECLVFLYLLLLYYDSSFLPKLSPISFSIIIFWAVNGLATIFSTQPFFSFFGNPFRGHGFFSQTHHAIFFLLLTGFFKKWEDWRKMLWLIIVVSFPAGIISVWEVLNGVNRVQATLNNTNFYSAYLLLAMFITVALFFRQKRPFLLYGEDAFKKIFLIIAFILQFFGVIFSRSRGAYIGLATGLSCFAFFFIWQWLRVKKRRVIFLLCLTFLTAFALFLQKDYIVDLYETVAGPIFQIEGRTRTIKQRTESYRTAILGIRDRPFLGFGPENFVVAFDKFYSGALESTSYPWFDKAHNIFLEVGVATGLLGLTAYLAIWFFCFKTLFLLGSRPFIKVGLVATFAAYLSQNMFNIDTTTSFIYVYFFWALTHFLWSENI